jgi:hypothetical protein
MEYVLFCFNLWFLYVIFIIDFEYLNNNMIKYKNED